MNRIAGILNFDFAPVYPQDLARMAHAQKHQPDDEEKLWADTGVGLGCIRFAPSAPIAQTGDWPFAEIDGAPPVDALHSPLDNTIYTITFDGRLDNRQELLAILRPHLGLGGRRFSDEELVLAAYEKWEWECPGQLLGDFAFAIWDRKNQRLFCARDPFGVKPFYYAFTKEFFLFASTPQALLASRKMPPAIHEERIADFLVNPLEGVDKTSSFYENIFRLPPAHGLIVQADRIRLERYRELCPALLLHLKTDEEYIEAFRELLRQSVHCRLQDLSVHASMLSGGMDSSAIVGIGRKALTGKGKSLHAFAVILNSLPHNRESSYISAVLDQRGLRTCLISETELSNWINALVHAIEVEAEPFDCLMNLNRAVYLSAQEQGITAVLDGVDGDVLLSGSGHLIPLWRQAALWTLFQETLQADGLTAEYKKGRINLADSFLSAIAPLVPDWMRKPRRQRRYRSAVGEAVRETIIDRDFAVQSRLGERFMKLDSHSPQPPRFDQMEFHKIALEHPFLTVGLERYERVASTFGIEARHPFTDVRLGEFCLGLPWQLKTRRGWTKMILRRGMEPYLPKEVVWRRDKDSLMWEVNRLVLKERKEYFYQVMQDERASLQPYIDFPKLMKFWQEYLTQGDETHAELIWSGIALAFWLRRQRKLFAAK